MRYSDGNDELVLTLQNGTVNGIGRVSGVSLGQDSYVFAGVFQFFFIRLAIFFGCLGIFMNLFRGEMLDKSLHFYLLTPVRREILMLGKYLAGLLAATVIFSVSTALQLFALLLQFDASTIVQYLDQNHGIAQMAAYLGVTVLACIGYGSIFLAAGLLFRNPIVPGRGSADLGSRESGASSPAEKVQRHLLFEVAVSRRDLSRSRHAAAVCAVGVESGTGVALYRDLRFARSLRRGAIRRLQTRPPFGDQLRSRLTRA